MPSTELQAVRERFNANVESVRELLGFDRVALSHAINLVEGLHDRLKAEGHESSRMNAGSVLASLKNVREHESLRDNYEQMFNQCVVLLVSYFGAALADVFRRALPVALAGVDEKALRIDIRVSLGDLRTFDAKTDLAQLVIDRKGLSFQDMKSTREAFQTYIGVEIDRDETMDNIIAGQACRHVIAHAGSVADEALIRQLRGAGRRTLKVDIRQDDRIQFSREEVEHLAQAMLTFVRDVVRRTTEVLHPDGT